MYCRNCGHESPEGMMKCEECGADFSKRLDFPETREPSPEISRSSSCLFNAIGYLIVFLLVGLAIAAAAVFICVLDVPDAPEAGYPEFILTIWEKVDAMQNERCTEEDAGGSDVKEAVEDPRVQLEMEEEEAEPVCGQPTIRIEPTIGVIGTTFDIYLEGFSANDEIEACWYFPDESLINCVDLDADENGYRKTRFWSEKNDPTGVYSMEAVGVCSRAEAIWDILPKDN